MNARSVRKPLLGVLAVTALLLLVPAVAMHVTDEVRWGPMDFAVAGGLLLTTGSAMVAAARVTRPGLRRRVLVGAMAAALLVVWAELAVGLFG